MTTLLSLTHPTYLRRLVREINANRAGVYLAADVAEMSFNPRLHGRASLRDGGAGIVFPVAPSEAYGDDKAPSFYIPASKITETTFIDGGSGRDICASRKA